MGKFPIMDYCRHGHFTFPYCYFKRGVKSFLLLEMRQDCLGVSMEWGLVEGVDLVVPSGQVIHSGMTQQNRSIPGPLFGGGVE